MVDAEDTDRKWIFKDQKYKVHYNEAEGRNYEAIGTVALLMRFPQVKERPYMTG